MRCLEVVRREIHVSLSVFKGNSPVMGNLPEVLFRQLLRDWTETRT